MFTSGFIFFNGYVYVDLLRVEYTYMCDIYVSAAYSCRCFFKYRL